MTREKIKNHILATITGETGSATVNLIALETMHLRLCEQIPFVCELAWELGCVVYINGDDGYVFTPDTEMPELWARFCAAHEEFERKEFEKVQR